ncbi:MAG TPA: ABC transporter permease [Candidatus Limnocylindrales bacterium]|nr:ABC transporter permease [Candidatus Limnocylindrales bacterium]
MKLRDLILVPVIVALIVAGAVIDRAFLSGENLLGLLRQQSELSLLVLAEAVILIAGRVDLSVESTVGLAPALAVTLVVLGLPSWTAIPLCLLAGVLAGLLNALLVVQFRLSAFAATLGTLIVLRGLHTGISDGRDLTTLPGSIGYLGGARWFGVPASIWVCGALLLAAAVFLGLFRPGRALYAIGGNIDAARAAGIRAHRVLLLAFAAAGLLAALAGMLMTGRLGSVAATQGQGMIFIVLAAAVIGGISLNGGKGTVFGALCGVLLLGLIDNVLRLAGVSSLWIQAIYGATVIAALVLARVLSGPRAPQSPSAAVP